MSVIVVVVYFCWIDVESKFFWEIDVGYMIDVKDCGSLGSVYSVKYFFIFCIKINLKDIYVYLIYRVFDLY